MPAGFTKEGLPVGLQIVGPPKSEARLLAAGKLLEEMLAIADKVPMDPRVKHPFPLGGRGRG
jgi:amidase